jgi:hypothetical protein
MAGILQTYNRATNQAVPTAGGWGQLSVYPADNLRLNFGYGIDHAQDSGIFGLQVNSGIFANVVWDVNAWVVISEVMFRL